MNDEDKELIDLAYSASAESVFVIRVGKMIQEFGQTRAETTHASNFLKYLTSPCESPPLSEKEQRRLKTMQRLLVATVARGLDRDRVDSDDKMQ